MSLGISNLFGSTVFQTIISGIVIFISSQFILEFILKPHIELRKLKALLSEKFLISQSKIFNFNLSEEENREIQTASSKLLALAWSVYFSKSKKNQFLDISQNVNLILSTRFTRDNRAFSEGINVLKKYKFLKVTFD
ncbi:MAG: hypothetical protein ABR980_11635 [Ignavibacteriaceae bacterium]|jgi:hypothetical protein